MTEPIGRLDVMALDCPDALALATFYQSLIGGDMTSHEDDEWVEVHTPEGNLAFQRIEHYRPPTWPGGDVPQQGHVDIAVDDLDVAEPQVLALGATKTETQPSPEQFRVFLDPVGHPFCLVCPQTGANESDDED